MQKGKESKPHIGIFGRRNNGKSSLINSLTNQDIAIVSDVAGTTTDPVKKSVEIPGLGPCVIIDTAGFDDVGDLGEKRVQKSLAVLDQIDMALLVITANTFDKYEEEIIEKFNEIDLPFFIVHNKSDEESLKTETKKKLEQNFEVSVIDFSNIKPDVSALTTIMRKVMPETAYNTPTLVGDLINYGDTVLLITPIDIEAPEGRMILPQVQVIRDVLDHDGIAVVCKEREVDAFIRKMKPKPALAITDSQVFLKADASVPPEIPLTGFSVLLARQRGDFENYLKGTPKISGLKDGDRVLLLESCTHHTSCDDIGRVKIPRWLSAFTGKKLEYEVVAGLNALPLDITEYAIVIQCGGCVITRKQIINRLRPAVKAGIPVTNYGMTIAYVQGIYERAIQPFLAKTDEDYL
ncbi:MAG: [FeFe] hydrogenase H-cluster maturation GTPase HydF [Marinilabiliales bacterium]|nr:MAG: [FeFe] hydrogenase H-cluster maturation GTPase HydF [Marinilabiliales bacterium]